MSITDKYQCEILNNMLASRIQHLDKYFFSPEFKQFQLLLYTILIDLRRVKLKFISINAEKD